MTDPTAVLSMIRLMRAEIACAIPIDNGRVRKLLDAVEPLVEAMAEKQEENAR